MSLSALTLQQLRYLVAVEGHRSFIEAARACHVSQPALSTQVRKVEELLGAVIFDRSRQPIVPTETGVRVVEQAKRALEQFDLIPLVVAESEKLSGPYRLGIIPTLVSTILPPALPVFTKTHPRVRLEIVEMKTEALIRQLHEGKLDSGIAATPLRVPGLEEEIICHERFFVYLPEGHALACKDCVSQSDLIEEHVWLLEEGHCFRTQVLTLCGADGNDATHLPIDFEANSFESLMRLVDAGLGITILPELLVAEMSPAQREARVRPFALQAPARDVSLVHARKHIRGLIRNELLQCLRANVPRRLEGHHEHPVSPLSAGSQN